MKKKVVILGTSYLSIVTYQTVIREGQIDVVAFSASKGFIEENVLEGLPVLPLEELRGHFDMDETEILITIGYSKMNDLREFYYNECKKMGYKVATFISKFAMVYTDDIGEGSILSPGCYVGPYAKIGKCCQININTYVSHHNEIGDYSFVSGGTMFGGNVVMGKKCFIGMQCVIKNGITIGDRVFLGANSYAKDNLESQKGYLGNPAQNKSNISSDLMIRFV